MNSTFKVVFNKARGALMVVNEITSSVQAKGTKTVVAAAVATMIAGVAGTAMAEEVAEPAAKSTITVNDANRSGIEKEDVFDGYTSGSDQYKSGAIYITDGKTTTFKDGVKFTNNTSEMSGGAIEVQAGTVTLKDAVITGNKADSWGGAIRMAGNSTVNLTVTKDTVYSGNKANANGKLDYPDMGDFVYMNGATNGQKTALNLKAEGDATLTVADSIASAGSNNEITTEGKVNVTGSMEAYTGDITVKSGTFKLDGGFGSYDLWTDSWAAQKNSNATAKLTVKGGATAELGALTITRTSQNAADTKTKIAGTNLVVEENGKLTVESITVASQQYVNAEKKFDWTSHGWGKLENRGEATVKDHITVEGGGKFDMTGHVTVGRINTAAKTDKLDAGVITHTNGTLRLNNGKSVNKGQVTVDHLELKDGSYFETTANYDPTKVDKFSGSLFKAESIYVGEGATLAFTDFNSNVKAGREEPVENSVNDQVLMTSHLELDGGSLNGLKNLKIGTSRNPGGKLTVTNGDYAFDNLTIAKGGDDNHSRLETEIFGGSLTVKSLYTDADVEQHDGTVTVTEKLKLEGQSNWHMNGGTLIFDKDLKIENLVPENQPEGNRQIVVGGGELKAWNSQIFGVNADKTDYTTLTKTGNQIMTGDDGFLTILDHVELTTDEVAKAVTAFANGNLTFQNLTLKTGAEEKVVFDQKYGTALLDRAVEAPASANGAVALSIDSTKTVGVGALKVDAKTKNVNAATGHLILGGLGGNVIEGVGEVETLVANKLSLGKTEASSGVVNAAKLSTKELNVNGDFTARAVEANSAQIDGMLTADSLTVKNKGKAVVAGALALTGNVKEDAAELSGNVELDEGSVLTTNVAAAKAIAGEFDEGTAIIYVDRQLKLDGATIGATTDAQTRALLSATATPAESTVKLDNNLALVVDASSFIQANDHDFTKGDDVSVLGKNTTLTFAGGEVEIINVSKLGKIDLGKSVTKDHDIDTDSIYVNAKLDSAETGIVTLAYNNGLVADKTVDARLENAFTNGVGAKEFAILSALDTPAFFDEKTEKFTEAGNKAFEQATGGNATAGVLNVAYDANAQVTDAIVRHQLSEHAGMGVWADVFYAKNEAKKLYGDFGYSADIYGGVLGFDYTAACGGTLGAALTVGTADADSEGGVLSNSLSSDFVGLSVYASKDFSGLNVKADLGYIDFSNDFTGLGDASDATTITFGVRGDFTAYQNGAFSVVPHMGLRYTRIDTDAVAFNDEQNMNVLEAPIGVKFAGTFEATGWKLVPSYDFTIVPQLGDKEVEAFGTAGDITILSGGLFNNVLGVEAVKDNMSFGLNASYGFGPDDRANTQVNANFRYHF
ncbi:outer membrane autotransporter barrel domain protein [Sutterella sp. KLE1602]|uniref:autotransporter domain-containing protein n=1 Tax=Sutterella sp. KLE1602 TaxID=1574262 RepID=UPI0007825D87|nr:autotransporter domain-containing protein [Sutterella sp. KLE1602]KXT33870.1 outer membrane autotransporter barrel domain protein [Sutterella sp. KLE1602]